MALPARTPIRIALSLILAGALLAPLFLYGGLDRADIESTFARLTLGVYFSALGLQVLQHALRTVRFRCLIPPAESPPYGPALAVTSAYTMVAFVLPAKLGEASFFLYANQVCGLPVSSGIASLVVSRLLDLATLAGSFSIATIVLQVSGARTDLPWLGTAGACLAAVSVACFYLSARGDVFVSLALRVVRLFGLERVALGRKLLTRSEQIAASIRLAGGEGRLVKAALVSIPIWLTMFFYCAVIARGLGLPSELTFMQATFGASLAIATSLIPISAFASFGTLEAGWVVGFGILGIPRDLAAATGLGMHCVQLSNVILLGVLGHLVMGAYRKR